jgi:hypothetical protein
LPSSAAVIELFNIGVEKVVENQAIAPASV